MDAGTSIPGNIAAAGYQLVLNGDVGGEVNFWGSGLAINAAVGGDVDAVVGDLQFDRCFPSANLDCAIRLGC